MKIGDLFYALRADGAQLKADVEKEADTATKSMASKFKGGLKDVGTGIKEGLGIGAGIGVIGLVTGAVSAVVDKLGEARRAYQEDQVSQALMKQALENNIPAWDGNTAAIEKVIESRMRLGFTDEEQRASLALLVGATHDVQSAQDAQAAAMDLARLKGIDLATATDILVKAHEGNFKGLKSVGIELDKNATFTDVLSAVTAVAGGQAEAFANTSLGKQEAAQIKVGEAMEKVGGVIDQVSSVVLPIFADVLSGVVDWLGQAWTFLEDTGVIKAFGDAFKVIGDVLRPVVGFLSSVVGFLGDVARFVAGGVGDFIGSVGGFVGGIFGGGRATGGPIAPGETVVVGEAGRPELVTISNGRGYVTPLAATSSLPSVPGSSLSALGSLGGAGIGGAAGDTFIVQLPTSARPSPFEVADELRRQSEMGMFR